LRIGRRRRIAATGDTPQNRDLFRGSAAKENHVPFYVAAPTSTFDLSLIPATASHRAAQPDGSDPHQGNTIAPRYVSAANPAFDVTPNKYITPLSPKRV